MEQYVFVLDMIIKRCCRGNFSTLQAYNYLRYKTNDANMPSDGLESDDLRTSTGIVLTYGKLEMDMLL